MSVLAGGDGRRRARGSRLARTLRTVPARLRRAVGAAGLGLSSLVLDASAAWAQYAPDAGQGPGGPQFRQLVNWGAGMILIGCVGAMVYHAGRWSLGIPPAQHGQGPGRQRRRGPGRARRRCGRGGGGTHQVRGRPWRPDPVKSPTLPARVRPTTAANPGRGGCRTGLEANRRRRPGGLARRRARRPPARAGADPVDPGGDGCPSRRRPSRSAPDPWTRAFLSATATARQERRRRPPPIWRWRPRGLLLMDPAARDAAVRRMLVPDASAETVASVVGNPALLERIRAAASSSGTPRAVLRNVPVAYRVDAFSPQRARVSVWAAAVWSIAGVGGPSEAWTTTTLELEWVDGDWRLWSLSSEDGPTPATTSGPVAGTEELIAALAGF